MAKIRVSKDRISGPKARQRMERVDVLVRKLGRGLTGIRAFWIIASICLLLKALLLLVLAPVVAAGVLVGVVCNVLFCELVLVKRLKRFSEAARKLSIAYLILASCLTFLALPLLVGVFVAVSTVPGLLALCDSRTKRVLAEERGRIAARKDAVQSGKICGQCFKAVTAETSAQFGEGGAALEHFN